MSNIYPSKHKGQAIDQSVVDVAKLKTDMAQTKVDIDDLKKHKANSNTVPKTITDLEPNASLVYTGSGEMPKNYDVQIDPNGEAFDIEAYVRSLMGKIQGTKTTTIDLPSSAWVQDGDNQYSQVVSISGITEYSKIDLQPTVEQLLIFYEKDVTFVAENEDGIVTIYCIGQKPANDYSMQATITEVDING